MNLKNILITSCLLGSISALGNPCLNKYKASDKTDLPGKVIKSKGCQFLWKNKKGQQEGIELIYMEKACQRFEGDKKVDCIFTRHCPANSKEEGNFGTPIYYEANYFNTLCSKEMKEELYPILGLKDEVPKKDYQALLRCIDKIPLGIVIKSGTGKEKYCSIPPL